MARHAFVTFGIVLVAISGALAKKESAVPSALSKQRQLALVRVNVTGQSYDYFRPWQKKAPFSKRALGAVLSKGRVLVTADLVANQNYVELERAESGEKTAASVEVIDYEANLALLQPSEKSFLEGITPLEITPDTVVGDRLAAWQLEPTGALLATEGLVTTVQMMPYPIDVGQFLTYRISIPMQYRENSYTVPLVKNNKLAGLLLRYDSRSQLLDAIPAPVITHFLKDAESQNYRGFPSAGFSFFPTRDPELREFAGEKGKGAGGVYVTNVEAGTPAMKAGLQVGDRQVDGDHGHSAALVDQAGDTDPDRLHLRHCITCLPDRVGDGIDELALTEAGDDAVYPCVDLEVLVDDSREELRPPEVDPHHLVSVASCDSGTISGEAERPTAPRVPKDSERGAGNSQLVFPPTAGLPPFFCPTSPNTASTAPGRES
jgi:S1-C subfamily serine protease